MKYNEFVAFVIGGIFLIAGALLFVASDNATNIITGQRLELAGYLTFIPGVLCWVSMFVLGRKPNV